MIYVTCGKLHRGQWQCCHELSGHFLRCVRISSCFWLGGEKKLKLVLKCHYRVCSYTICPQCWGRLGGAVTVFGSFMREYLEEEVGSVVCLWIFGGCWLIFSFRAVCTSAGMSGDVWLIFMAASRSFTVLRPFTFTSSGYFFSTSATLYSLTGGELGGGASGKPTWRPFSAWADRALLLQIGQHSFQKTKRDTTKRARPQKPTTTASRLIEMSRFNP